MLIIVAKTSLIIHAAPPAILPEQQLVQVVHTCPHCQNAGPSTVGRITRYVVIGGIVVGIADYRFFNGRFVLQPVGRWLFPGFFARLDRIDTRLENVEAGVTGLQTNVAAVQRDVTANGAAIAAAHEEVRGVRHIVDGHTQQHADHARKLATLTEQVDEARDGVRANGEAIAAAHADVQANSTAIAGVRTALDQAVARQEDAADRRQAATLAAIGELRQTTVAGSADLATLLRATAAQVHPQFVSAPVPGMGSNVRTLAQH
jgi:hypothetical protein